MINNIERQFLNAYTDIEEESSEEDGFTFQLVPQVVVGIYKIDFAYGQCAVEIDGHEYHKTKEQREYDYKRERYLLKNGWTPVRFMATEVFLDAKRCIREMNEIAMIIETENVKNYFNGIDSEQKSVSKKQGV